MNATEARDPPRTVPEKKRYPKRYYDPRPVSAEAARFGAAVVEARRRGKLTQVDAAKALGVPPRTYRSWETGHRTCPVPVRERVSELWGADRKALGLAVELFPGTSPQPKVPAGLRSKVAWIGRQGSAG